MAEQGGRNEEGTPANKTRAKGVGMEQARILRVVVASPGDVAAEREAVVRAAEEVNRNLGRDRGLMLEVYRWETEVRPGFHVDGPPGNHRPDSADRGL